MDEKLLSTILELARLGAVGIGAIVLLLAFFMLARSQKVDPEKGKLISKFMTLGFVFAGAAGVLGLVPLFAKPSGPVAVRLAFSPDFTTQGLSPPKVELPDGSSVQPDQKFALEPSLTAQVVTVGVDKTLDEVRNLRQASAKLAETVQTVTQQRDALATHIAPASTLPDLQVQSKQAAQLPSQIVKSVQVGDFAHANVLSSQLHSSIVNAKPALEAISRSHQ
jgi:hypothetical protein